MNILLCTWMNANIYSARLVARWLSDYSLAHLRWVRTRRQQRRQLTCRRQPGLLVAADVADALDGDLQRRQGHVGGQVGRVERRQNGDEDPPGGEQHTRRVCREPTTTKWHLIGRIEVIRKAARIYFLPNSYFILCTL